MAQQERIPGCALAQRPWHVLVKPQAADGQHRWESQDPGQLWLTKSLGNESQFCDGAVLFLKATASAQLCSGHSDSPAAAPPRRSPWDTTGAFMDPILPAWTIPFMHRPPREGVLPRPAFPFQPANFHTCSKFGKTPFSQGTSSPPNS